MLLESWNKNYSNEDILHVRCSVRCEIAITSITVYEHNGNVLYKRNILDH